MILESQLAILLITADRDGAKSLSREIKELFRGCRISGCEPTLALQTLRNRYFDLAVLHRENNDPCYYELVLNIGHLAADMPVIVSMPSGDDSCARQFDSLNSVHCLIRDDGFQKTVMTVIEEVLRDSADRSLDWIGYSDGATETQAELIRTTTGTLSHEINNPLMAILSISELILNDHNKYNPDITRKITMIRRSAERIESSLKRLASISEPVLRQTPIGPMIDPEQSRRTRKRSKTRS